MGLEDAVVNGPTSSPPLPGGTAGASIVISSLHKSRAILCIVNNVDRDRVQVKMPLPCRPAGDAHLKTSNRRSVLLDDWT